jgi:hypothetical protein
MSMSCPWAVRVIEYAWFIGVLSVEIIVQIHQAILFTNSSIAKKG